MAQQTTCKECGWVCRSCDSQGLLQLHLEVENLKQQLLERERHIHAMETNFLAEADKFPNGQAAALTEELLTWQDKYSRLYESYKRVQKVNQNLEDKLLKIVDKCETEKNELLKEVSALTQRLIDARTKVNRLQCENEQYKNDVGVAIQLLQCKPANFVPQKYDSLPVDLQQKVLAYVCGRRRPSDVPAVPIHVEMRTIKVPVSTSPPSAMLYSVDEAPNSKENCSEESHEDEVELLCDSVVNDADGHPPLDSVSAAIMAKVLAERERDRERQHVRHCTSCTCATHIAAITVDSSTQTCSADVESSLTILNGYTATTKESQGLVRFIDSLPRGNSQPLVPSRLGLKVAENRHLKCETLINLDPLPDSKNLEKTENGNSTVLITNNYESNKNHVPLGGRLVDTNISIDQGIEENVVKVSDYIGTASSNNVSNCSKLTTQDLLLQADSAVKLSSQTWSDNTQKTTKGDCIIDLKILSDGRCDILKANRGKEVSPRNSGEVSYKHVTSGLSQQSYSSQNFNLKGTSRENRNTSGMESARSPSNWIRYPSDNKKSTLVVSCDKMVSPAMRSSEANASRVQFPSASLRGSNPRGENSPGSGPRFCSMRLQAGTSNILLDNATSYEPILYTSRHTQDGVESWGVSASRSGAAVLVHAPRSRALSVDDAPPQNKVTLWVHANQAQNGT